MINAGQKVSFCGVLHVLHPLILPGTLTSEVRSWESGVASLTRTPQLTQSSSWSLCFCLQTQHWSAELLGAILWWLWNAFCVSSEVLWLEFLEKLITCIESKLKYLIWNKSVLMVLRIIDLVSFPVRIQPRATQLCLEEGARHLGIDTSLRLH